jgi:hypothetical protein
MAEPQDSCLLCFKQFMDGDVLIQYVIHGNVPQPRIGHFRCVMDLTAPEKKPEEIK